MGTLQEDMYIYNNITLNSSSNDKYFKQKL
jgi:hypothetical protein